MRSFFERILQFFSKHVLLLFFSGIIFLHMAVLATHLEIYNSQKFQLRERLNHEMLFFLAEDPQKISVENITQIVNDFNTYKFQVGNSRIEMFLSSKPAFKKRWEINPNTHENFLEDRLVENAMSFQIKKDFWLNYQLVPVYTLYQLLVYLVLFDFLILGLYLFYLFSLQRFNLPLINFKNSAEKLGIDINARPTKIFGPKVVQEAADAMNKLQMRIKDLISIRTQMLAAISHDLRTCVTRLKLRAHFLPESPHLGKIYDDLSDMELMIEDILNFAGEDMIKEKKINFDIVVLLFSICEDFMDQNHPIHINSNCLRLTFFGRRLSFKRTFTNLIQNALKYAGEVWVDIHCADNIILINIEDNGPGIPQDELEQVFQPFYRSSRARETHVGSGLGLTIAYEVINAHNGTIQITNRDQGGLHVKIILNL